MNQISTEIYCQNLAPIDRFHQTINTNQIRMAIFAHNGSGKSFLSRAFRLTEREKHTLQKENGEVETDKYISFGAKEGAFSFKVSDKQEIKENIRIDFNKGKIPEIPDTNYIFHTFNQDYVERNIRAYGYRKNGNISGHIRLDEEEIDISDEQEELDNKKAEKGNLEEAAKKETQDYIKERLHNIPWTRLKESEYLKYEAVFKNIDKPWQDVSKIFDQLLEEYNKVKAVPENLEDIKNIKKIDYSYEFFNNIKEALQKEYSLSSLSYDFRQKILKKESFIETGMKLKGEEDVCPFCEQRLDEKAKILLDEYNKYIAGTEAKVKKQIQGLKEKIDSLLKSIEDTFADNAKIINKFNEYKQNYIPSMKAVELAEIDVNELKNNLEKLVTSIDEKLKDISKIQDLNLYLVDEILYELDSINSTIQHNNQKIKELNEKKSKSSEENKNLRKQMCKVVFNELLEKQSNNVSQILSLRDQINKLNESINEKKARVNVSKRKQVAQTLKQILSSFFGDKYTFDEENFVLNFFDRTLQENQIEDVLSDGEKNVIAFAYYLADIHKKVETSEDYKKFFFIIDDPISSMDFNYVYALCDLIRNLRYITGKDRIRFIIFTHNIEFMRLLVSNNIAKNGYILKDNSLHKFDYDLAIPYIKHLLDVYAITEGEAPAHTTANSIRHIIETLTKFEKLDNSNNSVQNYIWENFGDDLMVYTAIQDLSHGAWREEQQPITEDTYKKICNAIIECIRNKYEGQIEFCKSCIR